MRIALDARHIYRASRRGTGKNLIDLYTEVLRLRADWRVDAYHRTPRPIDDPLPMDNVRARYIDSPGDRFDSWTQVRFPLAAANGVDLVHFPANDCAAWTMSPMLVTIHDLAPLDLGNSRRPADVRRFRRAVRSACRRAAGIICPSQYTADRLVRDFGARSERITVNPWAPDAAMRCLQPEACEPVLARYGVSSPFVLNFGGALERKNTPRMVESWARISTEKRSGWKLLIIGLDEATRQKIAARVAELGCEQSIVLRGFAPEADLPALLSGASVLAYPSLLEGFGLPILDAFAAKTAVLTSSTTSLPEVGGDAVVQVDPTDAGAIAESLAALMSDESLRAALVRKGTARLERYTWRAAAERFIAAAERAAAMSRALPRGRVLRPVGALFRRAA